MSFSKVKNILTWRRVLSLALVITMLTSLVNITTVGFADDSDPSSPVYMDQQINGSSEISSNIKAILGDQTVKYNAYTTISEADFDGITTASVDIYMVTPVGIQVDGDSYSISAVGKDDAPVSISAVPILNEGKLHWRVDGFESASAPYVITTSFGGRTPNAVVPGTVYSSQTTVSINDGTEWASNTVTSVVPITITRSGSSSITGSAASAFRVTDIQVTISSAKDGESTGTRTVNCDSNGDFTVYNDNVIEEGQYTYTVQQIIGQASNDTATMQNRMTYDRAIYRVEVPVTKDTNTGNLVLGTIGISRIINDSTTSVSSIVFSNATTQTPINSGTASKTTTVTLEGSVSAGSTVLVGGEFTFIIAGVDSIPITQEEIALLPLLDEENEIVENQSLDLSGNVLEKGLDWVDPDAPPENLENNEDIFEEITSEEIEKDEDKEDTDSELEESENQKNTTSELEESENQENTTSEVDSSENEDINEAPDMKSPAEGENYEDSDESIIIEEDDVPEAEPRVGTPPMPLQTMVSNNSDGSFSFGAITYTEAGTYTYRVSQRANDGSGFTQDTSIYDITVNVSETSAGNALTSSVVLSKNGQVVRPAVMAFVNTPVVTAQPKVELKTYQSLSAESNKTQSDLSVRGNDTITYYIGISNTGTAAATGIIITNSVPSGLTYVSGSASYGASVSNGVLTWSIPRLEPGVSATASFQVKVPSSSGTTRWTNTSSLTYTNNPDNTGATLTRVSGNTVVLNNTNSSNSPGSSSSDGLEVIIMQAVNDGTSGTGSINVYSDDTIKYTIIVTNKGSATLTNISVNDNLPTGLTIDERSVSSNGQIRRYNILWTIDRLEVGSSANLTFSVTVPNITSSLKYENYVQAYPQANTTSIATSNTVVAQAYSSTSYNNLSIDITQSLDTYRNATDKELQVKSGDEITYYITVYNNSNTTSQKMTITDEIPSGLELVSRSISDEGYSSRGKITWEIDKISAGRSVTVSFSATVPNSGSSWKNKAVVTLENQSSKGLTSNEVTATLNGSSLSLAQTMSVRGGASTTTNSQVTAGDTVTYTFTLTNATSSVAPNVTITDVIPNGLTIVPTSLASTGSVSGNTVTWNVGNMPANTRYTVSVQVTVQQSTVGTTWNNVGVVNYGSNNNNPNSVSSNTLALTYVAYSPNNSGTAGNGPTTGAMGDIVDANGNVISSGGSNGSGGSAGGTGGSSSNSSNFAAVGEKIPQTGGFNELHLWVFILMLSGGGLVIMALTSPNKKRI